MFTLAISCLTTQFGLIHGPNIPGSNAILLFTALDFTSTTSHIHNWALLSLWLSEEELKSFLMKVKEESEKADLKLNIQKTKIMASSPITSWQIDGETVETVTDFIFMGSKISAGGDCSHKIKRCLLLGRKVMTNLDSICKTETLLCQQRSV